MPQNIYYTFSIFLLQLTILLTFSGFSHPNHQSPCHCLWGSPHCSQHFTGSINSLQPPKKNLIKGRAFALLSCSYSFLLHLPVKSRCFLTAFCPTPLIVPMTSLCNFLALFLSSLFTAFPSEKSFLACFPSQMHLCLLPLWHLFSTPLQMQEIYFLDLQSRFNL